MHRFHERFLIILCVASGLVCCGLVYCGAAAAQDLRSGEARRAARTSADAERSLLGPAPVVDLPNTSDHELLIRLEAVEAELSRLQASSLPLAPASPSHIPACETCGTWSCGGACEAVAAGEMGGGEKADFPSLSLTGAFQLDGGYYDQSSLNQAVLGDIQDGLGFRRARLAAKGKVSDRTSYIMEFDFAQGQARFVDIWMEFAETPLGNLRIGRFRQPFGMSELTSIREIPFLERPLHVALSPFRQTGAMLSDTAMDESLTWAVSGYRYLSDNYGNVYADDGGYGLATRLTGLLVDRGDEDLIHLGADYSYNDPGRERVQYASTNEFFAGQNPELGPDALDTLPIVAVPPFVNTGRMPTEHSNLFNLEGALSRGHWLVQGEAHWAAVELSDGTSNTFPGAYAHVRYVLTGETIPYNRQAGVFGRIQPRNPVNLAQGCWGAWEVAARASYLDLNGDDLPGPGRRLSDTTLGLNWYVNGFTKFQLNWIHSDLDDPDAGSSRADTYAFRGQLDF